MKKIIILFSYLIFVISSADGQIVGSTAYSPIHYAADMSGSNQWTTRALIDRGYGDGTYFKRADSNTHKNPVTVDSLQKKVPCTVYTGTVTPVHNKSAVVGSLYIDRADTTIWLKLVGIDSNGWYSVRKAVGQ